MTRLALALLFAANTAAAATYTDQAYFAMTPNTFAIDGMIDPTTGTVWEVPGYFRVEVGPVIDGSYFDTLFTRYEYRPGDRGHMAWIILHDDLGNELAHLDLDMQGGCIRESGPSVVWGLVEALPQCGQGVIRTYLPPSEVPLPGAGLMLFAALGGLLWRKMG